MTFLQVWYGKNEPSTTKARIQQSKEKYCNTEQTKN